MKALYKAISIFLFLFIPGLVTNAQAPATMFLGTDLPGGSYVNNAMTDKGSFYQKRLQETGTTGSGTRKWEFNADSYYNTWRAPNTTPINIAGHNQIIAPSSSTASAYFRNSYGGGDGARLQATTNGNYYTFNLTKYYVSANVYNNQLMEVLETSYNPKSISGAVVTFTISKGNYGATDVNLSSLPTFSTGEYMYCRYTNNSYASSELIQVVPSGASASITIPSQVPGTSISFYFYTSNKTLAQINADVVSVGQFAHDLATLEVLNNSGSNYTGTTVSANIVVNSTAGSFTFPSGYSNLNTAFDNIKNGNHQGVITIGIYNSTVEGNECNLVASGTNSAIYTSIKIAPAGAASLKTINGSALAANKTLIHFDGADGVTIDGRLEAAGSARYLKFLHPNSNGLTVFTFDNDASSDTLRYCYINSDISGITYQVSIASASVGSVYFDTDDFADNGTNSPYGCINTTTNANSVSIRNCNFYNFKTYGVILMGTLGGTIKGNSFYQSSPLSDVSTSAALYMLYVSGGNNWTIDSNYFGGSAPGCGGSAYINTATTSMKAMILATSMLTNTNSVTRNTIQNFNLSGSSSTFEAINMTAGWWVVGSSGNGNTIGHASTANSILLSGNGSTFYGIHYVSGSSKDQQFQYNTVANISLTGTTSTGSLFGMSFEAFGPVPTADNINNNAIYNLSASGSNTSSGYTAQIMAILYKGSSGRTANIFSNTIYSITAANTGAVTTEVNGIVIRNSNTNVNVYANKMYGFKNLSSSNTGYINGIHINDGSSSAVYTVSIYNNMITLTNPSQSNGVYLFGVLENGNATYTQTTLTNNTIYLGGTQSAGSNNTYPYFRMQGNTAVLKNNIFYNERSGGLGSHFALGNNITTGWTSNYNLFVNTDASLILSGFSANGTFTDWKAKSSGDASSMSETVANIPSGNLFSATASADLSIVTANKEAWFCNGTGVPTSLATDYNGDSRSTVVTSGATDIGADEFVLTSGNVPASTNLKLVSGSLSDGSTQVYTFGGRPVLEITWFGSGLPTSITALYLPGSYNIYGGCPGKDQLDANWRVDVSGATGDPNTDWGYHIKYYFDAATLRGMTLGNTLGLAKRPTVGTCSDWIFCDANNSGSPTNFFLNTSTFPYYIGRNEWHGFSIFSVSSSSNPLPVKLVQFNATLQGVDGVLTWSTATEKNNDRFEIERSADGKVFETIGTVSGKGNSNSIIRYAFTDKAVAQKMQGDVYYRLKQVDMNGQFAYSQLSVIHILKPGQVTVTGVSPNPFSTSVSIQYTAPVSAPVVFRLLDMQGREISRSEGVAMKGSNSMMLATEHIAKGMYLLNVEYNHTITTQKVLVKN